MSDRLSRKAIIEKIDQMANDQKIQIEYDPIILESFTKPILGTGADWIIQKVITSVKKLKTTNLDRYKRQKPGREIMSGEMFGEMQNMFSALEDLERIFIGKLIKSKNPEDIERMEDYKDFAIYIRAILVIDIQAYIRFAMFGMH